MARQPTLQDLIAALRAEPPKPQRKAGLARHTPDRDVGGAQWRADYEDWRSRNRRVVGWSRKSVT